MKSQFLLAFNEICKDKNLPPETVIDALRTALVSAYRRDHMVTASQEVTADIDPMTGEVAILAEKEVVEDVFDSRTEVTLEQARLYKADAELDDMVMADATPKNFGRIAAQTAKQVILQRVREAERDHLFDEFQGREGEIVNGTVQSLSGGNITIGLGRTEAVLPRNQQVNGERYRAHDKIRVYILEVRRTNRGPQIFVSRSHRNLLRRLLELEVPEIYNGQVDLKSIAREAGARSKVAVEAMQPGVDPVGACVGMRGVRIQSIVRELNDEKIDVIEWDEDPKNFIAKALSPARVSQVFLDDDPDEGRTATVVVPDDQLSLAIGREGQNARLAAKLTGWRIDIKSLTEAGRDSLNMLDNPKADPALVADEILHERIREVIAKKEAGRPITAEDFGYINRLIVGVEGRIIASRAPAHEAIRRAQYEARRGVPEPFYEMEMEELDLLLRVHNAVLAAGYKNPGDVSYQYALDKSVFLELEDVDEEAVADMGKKIETLKENTDYELPEEDEEMVSLELESAMAEALAIDEVEPVAEAAPVVEEEGTLDLGDDLDLDLGELEGVVAATVSGDDGPFEYEPDPLFAIDEETIKSDAELEAEEAQSELDDLSQSLVGAIEETRKAPTPKKKTTIRITQGMPQDEEEVNKKKTSTRSIIFDEKAGRAFAHRKRKSSRTNNEWSDEDEF